MGSIISKKVDRRILVLGLDNSGKTTLIKRLSGDEEMEHTIPTVGFDVDHVKLKNFNLNVWDVGGQDTIRHLWRHYYTGTDALVYAVDGTDHQRIGEAAQTLKDVASDPKLSDVVILVLSNKQDIDGALSPSEMIEKMGLNGIKQTWSVMACSALTGQGCDEIMVWLGENLKKQG